MNEEYKTIEEVTEALKQKRDLLNAKKGELAEIQGSKSEKEKELLKEEFLKIVKNYLFLKEQYADIMNQIEKQEKTGQSESPVEENVPGSINIEEGMTDRQKWRTLHRDSEGNSFWGAIDLNNAKIGDTIRFEVFIKKGEFAKYTSKIKDIVNGKIIFENGMTSDDVSTYMNETVEKEWDAIYEAELKSKDLDTDNSTADIQMKIESPNQEKVEPEINQTEEQSDVPENLPVAPAKETSQEVPTEPSVEMKQADIEVVNSNELKIEIDKIIKENFKTQIEEKGLKYLGVDITNKSDGLRLQANFKGGFMVGSPKFFVSIKTKEGKIIALNPDFQANTLVQAFVSQKQITEMTSSLGEKVQTFIEKSRGKKINRIDIENGNLKIEYK